LPSEYAGRNKATPALGSLYHFSHVLQYWQGNERKPQE